MSKYLCVRLKVLRREKGLTQKEFAKLLNISVQKLSAWENLTQYPDAIQLSSLTYYLNARIDYILGKSSVRNIPEDLPYENYENYIKQQEKINKKNKVN